MKEPKDWADEVEKAVRTEVIDDLMDIIIEEGVEMEPTPQPCTLEEVDGIVYLRDANGGMVGMFAPEVVAAIKAIAEQADG